MAEVIDALSSGGLLSEIGLKDSHARTLKARGSIPSHWHAAIAEVAARHRLPITLTTLAKLASRRRPTAAVSGAEATP